MIFSYLVDTKYLYNKLKIHTRNENLGNFIKVNIIKVKLKGTANIIG